MTLIEYRDYILEYLEQEKNYLEEDIRFNENLSDEEKVDIGLLIQGGHIVANKGNEYELEIETNNTKLRPGDVVSLNIQGEKGNVRATIIENGLDKITLSCDKNLSPNNIYDIRVVQSIMIGTLINLIRKIDNGSPGAAFLRYLGGIEKPNNSGLGSLEYEGTMLSNNHNERQQQACINAFRAPNLYCIQGPPGTGKTKVLATIANAFSKDKQMVVIISNTHQAVNNALNEISRTSLDTPVIKIGNSLKSQNISPTIGLCEKFYDYILERKTERKKRKITSEYIVGMTLQCAFVNIGLRNTSLTPSVILVDEASQMPLVEAAAIGTFGASTTIFIGDDRQMPPIFHEKLKNHELSTSIFSHLSKLYPNLCLALNETYRMNEDITNLVSRNYYEPYGLKLVASEFSRERKLQLGVQCEDKRIEMLLSSEKSLHQIDVTQDETWEDYNVEEAQFIASLVKSAIEAGMSINDLAVITPYRRQVRTIRQCCLEYLNELPLIDTVERLQGQDVDLIIISMCVSSPIYYNNNKHFLFEPNRLNVMFSRAKKKVIVVAPKIFKSLI